MSGPNWNLVDTFISGPDGKYAFRRSKEPVIVALYVYSDQYYDIIEKAVKFPERKQEIEIVMDPYTWLKLNVDVHFTDLNTKLMYWGGGWEEGDWKTVFRWHHNRRNLYQTWKQIQYSSVVFYSG